jgi:hypothetical protein
MGVHRMQLRENGLQEQTLHGGRKISHQEGTVANKPFHPEGTFRPPTTEACLNMALQCRCRFGPECKFSHDPAQFPPGLKATVRNEGKCPPQVNRQDRDFQQPPSSRKRHVDEPYSLQGHGHVEPKYARTNPRGSGIGGRGTHRSGRGKGDIRQYPSTDVRAGKGETPYRTIKLPFDPRLRDEKGRRIGELPQTTFTKAEWQARKKKNENERANEDEASDADPPFEDEHTDQNMDP